MTAFGSVADAVRLVKAGALDYLEKPFNLDDLVETVRMTVSDADDRGERGLRGSVEEAERAAIMRSPRAQRLGDLEDGAGLGNLPQEPVGEDASVSHRAVMLSRSILQRPVRSRRRRRAALSGTSRA